MPIDFVVLGFVMSVIALIPFILYLIQRYIYVPKIFFRISGEQSGEPIKVPKDGKVMFLVSTKSQYRTFISDVWIHFNPDEVDLFKTIGCEPQNTTEESLPFALHFSGNKVTKNKFLQGFFLEHKAMSPRFILKFIAQGQIDETETPFHDMFPVRKLRYERLVRFEVRDEYQADLKKTGLHLEPSEEVRMDGVQAQGEVWAASDKPGAQLKVLEILNDK